MRKKMNDDDPFESPKLLVESARSDIQDFSQSCDSFLACCYGVPVEKYDKVNKQNVIKYQVKQRIPGKLRVKASNIINNLRHALDQAVNCAAIELGAIKRNNYFPFASNIDEFEKAIKDKCRTVHPALLPLIRSFKPYKGGDDLLYSLTRLAGANKHQVMLRVDMNLTHFIMNDLISQFTGPGSCGFLDWDHKRQEIEIARIQHGGLIKCNPRGRFPLFISFGEESVDSSAPSSVFLGTILPKVEIVINAIEAETIKIKSL